MLKRARLLCYLVLCVSRAVLSVVLGAWSVRFVGWADWVDCRCFLSFVFLGGARCLELSPCSRKHLESTRTTASRHNSQTKHQAPSKPKRQVAKHQTAQQPCTPPAQQHPACAIGWWGKCRCTQALQPPASPTPPPPRPCLLPSMAPRLLTHLSLPPQQHHQPLGMRPLPGTPQLSLSAKPQH